MRPALISDAATHKPFSITLNPCHFQRLPQAETSFLSPSNPGHSSSQITPLSLKTDRPILSYPLRPGVKASSLLSSSMASTPHEAVPEPFSVLFVCLGNICRSPAAEAVFTDLVKKRGIHSKFNIDSAGTLNYHEGSPADSRMRAAAKNRGIEVTSISRPIRPSDFREFNLIIAMDKQNYEDILNSYKKWNSSETLPADGHKKVVLMCSYCKKHNETEVPDPYFGGPQGFEKCFGRHAATKGDKGMPCLKVLDLLEDACESLLDSLSAGNCQPQKRFPGSS